MILPYNAPCKATELYRRLFPGDRRDLTIRIFQGPMRLDPHWEEGSKDDYKLSNFSGGPAQVAFEESRVLRELPAGVALFEHGWTQGKRKHVILYVASEEDFQEVVQGATVAQVELTDQEIKAINVMAAYKAAYRAKRFMELGLGHYLPIQPLLRGLIEKGLVRANRTGSMSLTITGKQARDQHRITAI